MVIAKELELPSRIRIDFLAVDKNANLVIIELKRDASGSAVDWQAIKYASYCSTFTTEQIFTFHAEYLQSSGEEAQSRIEQFIDEEPSSLNQGQSQRIILVAREFHPDVASAVLWLRDFGVDITCIRLRAYEDSDGDLFINPDIIIPPSGGQGLYRRKGEQTERGKAGDSNRKLFLSGARPLRHSHAGTALAGYSRPPERSDTEACVLPGDSAF